MTDALASVPDGAGTDIDRIAPSDEKGRPCHIAHPSRNVDGNEPLISLQAAVDLFSRKPSAYRKTFRGGHIESVAENSSALLRNGLRSVRLLIVGYIPIFDQRDERLAAVLATGVYAP